MPFENNGTIPKWHMINSPPETDKLWCLKKMVLYGTPYQIMTKGCLPTTELSEGILNFLL